MTASLSKARVDGLVVYVKGESLSRPAQERVQGEVKGWMEVVGVSGVK
jgi:hypothetical protein